MNLEEHLKNNKRHFIIHWPSIFYGFVIGAIIAALAVFAYRPITFADQMGCDNSLTIELVKGVAITSCDKEK